MEGCKPFKPVGIMMGGYKRNLGKVIPTTEGAHDRFKPYDRLSIVYDEETLVGYISRQCVPVGVELTNREYWQPMNVAGYADDNIIIFSDRNQAGQMKSYTLTTAVPCVEISGRKNGTIISFFNAEPSGHWEIWQYQNVDTVHWEELEYWKLCTNIYNKFVGWYDTVDELNAIPVDGYVGKYAIVGDSLTEAYVYEGTIGGWENTGVKFYQKIINDILQDGVITLTELQQRAACELIGAIFKDDLWKYLRDLINNIDDYSELLEAFYNLFLRLLQDFLENIDSYPDLLDLIKKLIEKYSKGSSLDWGEYGRPFTEFEIISEVASMGKMEIKYPSSIYHDNSAMLSYNGVQGKHNMSYLDVPSSEASNLDLKFTAGAWIDITNNGSIFGDNYSNFGQMTIDITSAPHGLKVTVDDNEPVDWQEGFGVMCDGGSHVVTFIREDDNVNVHWHFYSTPSSSYVGEEIVNTVTVEYGTVINPADYAWNIIDVPGGSSTTGGYSYYGHSAIGWATNNKVYDTAGLEETDNKVINKYNVVGKSNVTPSYYDFTKPVTNELHLYCWYDIDTWFSWTDGSGAHTFTKHCPYNSNVTVPSVGSNGNLVWKGFEWENSLYTSTLGPVRKASNAVGVWENLVVKYTVKFMDSDGTTTLSPTQTINEGGKALNPGDPTKEGFNFTGWKLNGSDYDFNTPVMSNIVLTASWSQILPKYTVTFNANGGKPAPAAQTIVSGEKATQPTTPTKSGYSFKGWFNGSTLYNFNNPVTSNLTLNAEWDKIDTSVEYVITNRDGNETDLIVKNPEDTLNGVVIEHTVKAGKSYTWSSESSSITFQVSKGQIKSVISVEGPSNYEFDYLPNNIKTGAIWTVTGGYYTVKPSLNNITAVSSVTLNTNNKTAVIDEIIEDAGDFSGKKENPTGSYVANETESGRYTFTPQGSTAGVTPYLVSQTLNGRNSKYYWGLQATSVRETQPGQMNPIDGSITFGDLHFLLGQVIWGTCTYKERAKPAPTPDPTPVPTGDEVVLQCRVGSANSLNRVDRVNSVPNATIIENYSGDNRDAFYAKVKITGNVNISTDAYFTSGAFDMNDMFIESLDLYIDHTIGTSSGTETQYGPQSQYNMVTWTTPSGYRVTFSANVQRL